jgi:hypothetical protein
MSRSSRIGKKTPSVRQQDPQAGFSYVILLILITVVTILGIGFISTAGMRASVTMNRLENIQAEYLAESAVNHALWRLRNEPAFPAAEDRYYMHTFGAGRYGYMVRKPTARTFATIAALGAVGESVVKRSHVLLFRPPKPTQMITGTYSGNGQDNRPITEVGFQPDVVIIKGDIRREAVIRTATMVGDMSKALTSSSAATTNMVQSLDTEGFTIGNTQTVNKGNITYYWAAFRAVSGQMKLGSYTGDGVAGHQITSVGFEPDLTIIMPAGNLEVVHKSSASTLSFNFSGDDGSSNCILDPFLADGFSLGDDDRVNRNGDLYFYVCWTNVAGVQTVGSYTGDGFDDRDVTGLGFQPEYVIVASTPTGPGALPAHQRMAIFGPAMEESFPFVGLTGASDKIQLMIPDGFQIGSDTDVNDPGMPYEYLAWVRK